MGAMQRILEQMTHEDNMTQMDKKVIALFLEHAGSGEVVDELKAIMKQSLLNGWVPQQE
jgi:hypothetical protein